jgi:hypothetical protein
MWVFRYSDDVAAGGPYNIQISMEMNTNIAKVTFVDDLFPVTDGGSVPEENTDAGGTIENPMDSGMPTAPMDAGEETEVNTDSGSNAIDPDAGTSETPILDAGSPEETSMTDAGTINTTQTDAGPVQASDAGTADSEITCADNPCEPGQKCKDNPEGYECRVQYSDFVIEPDQIIYGCGCQQSSSSKETALTFSLLFLWTLIRRNSRKRNRLH